MKAPFDISAIGRHKYVETDHTGQRVVLQLCERHEFRDDLCYFV